MNSPIDSINTILRPALKHRIGIPANINGAKSIIYQQTNTSSYSGSKLALTMVYDAIKWFNKTGCYNVKVEPLFKANEILDQIRIICSKADNTHSSGSKALAGAAIGLNFGLLGAIVGAVGGWAIGQSASNNDISAITTIALQAIDYFCDAICDLVLCIENEKAIEKKSNSKEENNIIYVGVSHSERNGNYPRLSDVIGLDEAKQAIQERVIDPAKHPDIYKKYGYKAGGGILLFGLPGTGKTMFAQAVANELDGKFFSIKASDIKSKWFGETEEKIKSLFADARKEKVSIIFIDEFEAIGQDRSKDTNDITATTVVPELLAQMQGFEKNEDNILLIICATNRPWDIDSALTRPGRLDYKVYVELPNSECILSMFKNYLKKVKIMELALKNLVDKTDGYNGADIKNVCDSLIKIVIKKEISGITNYHLDISDVEIVLGKIKSSVSQKDIYKMDLFRKQI